MEPRSDTRQWVRKIDGDMHVVAEQPRIRLYPGNLDEAHRSVQLALEANPPVEARAIGSHWGISHCGVTQGTMIETATPVHETDGDQAAARLNHQLFDVVPACLTQGAIDFFRRQDVRAFDPTVQSDFKLNYLFHVEAGMRIHELYALMDGDDAAREGSLAEWLARHPDADFPERDYSGPWALETMGGAGGQTIVGAFSTGTHGGDVRAGPIAGVVLAIHLIDGKGKHHWIERTQLRPGTIPLQLTDPDKLQVRYPDIEWHRDDDLMNAAVIACGRFGMIYSVVLRAVRQFALDETRSSDDDWKDFWRGNLLGSPMFGNDHFVQLVINPYGTFFHPDKHVCYLTTRVIKPLAGAGTPPLGRAERGVNPGSGKPLGKRKSFSSRACASDEWLWDEINHQLSFALDARDVAIETWLVAGAVIIFPLTPAPVRLLAMNVQNAAAITIATTTVLIDGIGRLLAHLVPGKFGDTLAAAMNFCIWFRDPVLGIAPLLPLMRALIGSGFDGDQEADPDDPHTPAISYAAMDIHDYTNVGCVSPGDSIEVFFEANSNLIAFIDRILDRVDELDNGEITGSPGGFGGYIALRFMTQSPAFLAMQRWPLTCSVEVGGLSQVTGSDAYVAQVHADALEFGGIIHWGQKNDCTQTDVEIHFGEAPGTALHSWRKALSALSDNGAQALFSTPFSRDRGLEVTEPKIESLSSVLQIAAKGEVAQVTWEASRNPPETTALLDIVGAAGTVRNPVGLSGKFPVAFLQGRFKVRLSLERELNGRRYPDSREIELQGFDHSDEWTFHFDAEQFQFLGDLRWLVDINLDAPSISSNLKVFRVASTFGGMPSWIVRHPQAGDRRVTPAASVVDYANPPLLARSWRIFSEAPAAGAAAPLDLRFFLTF